jgi:hypothetical protein
MERFVRRENIKHYRELLRDAKSAAERQRIQRLLAEELQKQRETGARREYGPDPAYDPVRMILY